MLKVNPQIEAVRGFRVAGIKAGLKPSGAHDLALIVSDAPCTAAGVFTTNQSKAAPIFVSQAALAQQASNIRAVVVNTRCANALTGELGIRNAKTTQGWVADLLGVQPMQILPMSTGVIGTQLPMDKLERGIQTAYQHLGNDWASTAQAIMTTDTRPKSASITVRTAEGEYTIAGISKGAGMIAPNMATMLGVIVTDAKLSAEQCDAMLKSANDISFNRIVVDGDTSTNDCVFLLANGASGVNIDTPADEAQFQQALAAVCIKLAQDIVRDGEGATKFITLHVSGAQDSHTAHQIAHTIAASPLVKTAFHGGDANWGRIVAAAGRAGVPFNPDTARLMIRAGESLPAPDEPKGLLLFEHGTVADYQEKDAAEIFRHPSAVVMLECGAGTASAVVWTCDLSKSYVDINADYRS